MVNDLTIKTNLGINFFSVYETSFSNTPGAKVLNKVEIIAVSHMAIQYESLLLLNP